MYYIYSDIPDDVLVRNIIEFWNYVDMIFRQIESPKVILCIAGIIIPMVNFSPNYLNIDVNKLEVRANRIFFKQF